MRIDLHLHSTASDGALAPADVVRAAASGGLDLIALTDHDTAAGVPAARAAAADHDIAVIPGIEVSSTLREAGTELHILGYRIDPEHPALVAHVERAGERRARRMRGMIARLADLGVHVNYEDVVAEAGPDAGSLGRPHLARVLVRQGEVSSFGEAFGRYLADDAPASLPTELIDPERAIGLIHEAGGLAVWAHPPMGVFDREVRRLADAGLDGIECLRPRNSPRQTQLLEAAARDLDLLVTGGSDWHGEWHGRLGDFYVEREDVTELARLGVV